MGNVAKFHQIGEVAKEAKTSVDTIRFYEKLGLLSRAPRSPGGFRLYSRDSIDKLKFIRKAQELGLNLSEIKSIIQCSQQGLTPCCDLVRQLFARKIRDFTAKIEELQEMKRNLETLLSEWIPPGKAKKKVYAVCPQIEKEPKKKKRR